ncbi:cell division protein ZipA C-terminal FtsZ-binding domain-containing protein, partial [Burkholderia pseudomallei]
MTNGTRARGASAPVRESDDTELDGACMDELTLGLIGAGAVVVGGVVVYNAWQGAKVRRRMPRPMPSEAE